jgi:hypothetical protein
LLRARGRPGDHMFLQPGHSCGLAGAIEAPPGWDRDGTQPRRTASPSWLRRGPSRPAADPRRGSSRPRWGRGQPHPKEPRGLVAEGAVAAGPAGPEADPGGDLPAPRRGAGPAMTRRCGRARLPTRRASLKERASPRRLMLVVTDDTSGRLSPVG